MYQNKIPLILFIIFICFSVASTQTSPACKDLIACGEATAGEYNLMLKVRDPSRPGLQVLTRIPQGYTYVHWHPWTGQPQVHTVEHDVIGVASKGDTPPEIVKAGMFFTKAGIAFGDADSKSNWVNPRIYAWDDFDWIRYAGQQANTVDEAVYLLTEDAVDRLHATGVSENLFVIGPKKAKVIEADAYHHVTHTVEDLWVMTNYPKALWDTRIFYTKPIATSFDTVETKTIQAGQTIHLGSLQGVFCKTIEEESIILRASPLIIFQSNRFLWQPQKYVINEGESKQVGNFFVTVNSIENNQASLTISTIYYAWEQEILGIMKEKYGKITVEDMMNWSRLHNEDINAFRPLCEHRYPYEGSMIFKIPESNEDWLSTGWFAANHACTSIFVPVHICNTEFFPPYATGEAAQLSLNLLNSYPHDALSSIFHRTEQVFLYEQTQVEQHLLTSSCDHAIKEQFLSELDIYMQQQAYLTQQLWYQLQNIPADKKIHIQSDLENMWAHSYQESLLKMYDTYITSLNHQVHSDFIDTLTSLFFSVGETMMYIGALP